MASKVYKSNLEFIYLAQSSSTMVSNILQSFGSIYTCNINLCNNNSPITISRKKFHFLFESTLVVHNAKNVLPTSVSQINGLKAFWPFQTNDRLNGKQNKLFNQRRCLLFICSMLFTNFYQRLATVALIGLCLFSSLSLSRSKTTFI